MPSPFSNCLDASTRYCAVLGHPVRHSASPQMQNAGIARLGLNWRYLAFDVAPGDLKAAVGGAMRMGFVGLNLTVPHKVAGLECVDLVDEPARAWGAINTIRFEGRAGGGPWQSVAAFDSPPEHLRATGFNTDADAIVRAIREDLGTSLEGARVLLLGAGGAGRVAALRIAQEKPAELYLVNRTLAKAAEVQREVESRFGKVRAVVDYPSGKINLVVNATSLGLKPNDPLPFEVGKFSLQQAAFAFDMVYQAGPTTFLAAAQKAGCKVADGLSMLLYQGAAALELWSGQTAPIDAMREALLEKVGRRINNPK